MVAVTRIYKVRGLVTAVEPNRYGPPRELEDQERAAYVEAASLAEAVAAAPKALGAPAWTRAGMRQFIVRDVIAARFYCEAVRLQDVVR